MLRRAEPRRSMLIGSVPGRYGCRTVEACMTIASISRHDVDRTDASLLPPCALENTSMA